MGLVCCLLGLLRLLIVVEWMNEWEMKPIRESRIGVITEINWFSVQYINEVLINCWIDWISCILKYSIEKMANDEVCYYF